MTYCNSLCFVAKRMVRLLKNENPEMSEDRARYFLKGILGELRVGAPHVLREFLVSWRFFSSARLTLF